MLDTRDLRFTLSHSLIHGSWLTLFILLISALAPNQTLPYWVGLITFLPLLSVLVLAEIARLGASKPPRSMGNLARWILGVSMVNYGLASLLGLMFSPLAFEPGLHNIASSIALGAFLLLDAGHSLRWYNRRFLYDTLKDRSKSIQDVLRPQQVLVGNAWNDLHGLQTQNSVLLVSGLFLFLGARSSVQTETLAVLALMVLLGSAIFSLSIINQVIFEHRLFSLSCYPPVLNMKTQGRIRFILVTLGFALAFLLPWKTSLVPAAAIFAFLASLFQFMAPDNQAMESTILEVQERLGMRNQDFLSPVPSEAGVSRVIDIFGLLGTIVAAVWLFFLLIRPLYLNRHQIIPLIQQFLASIWATVLSFFSGSQDSGKPGHRMVRPGSSLAFTKKLLEKEEKKARAWNNQVIKQFADWLAMWQKEGLELHASSTVRDILESLDRLPLMSRLSSFQASAGSMADMQANAREIGALFTKEVFDRQGLNAKESQELVILVQNARSLYKALKSDLKATESSTKLQ